MSIVSLIKNEGTKLIKRPFIWIFALIILLSAIVFAVVFSMQTIEEERDIDLNWEEELENNIENLQWMLDNSKDMNEYEASGWKSSIQSMQYCLDNEIKPSDWRSSIVSSYIEALNGDDAELAGYFKTIIENDDWREYYKYSIKYHEDMFESIPNSKASRLITIDKFELALKYNIKPTEKKDDANKQLIMYIQNMSQLIDNELSPNSELYYLSDNQIKALESENKILLYKMEHKIAQTDIISIENYMFKVSEYLIFIVAIISVIISATSIAGEYTLGTIKNLLIMPCRRKEIIFSKIIVISISVLVMTLLLMVSSMISGLIAFGEPSAPKLFVSNDDILEINYYKYILLRFLFGYIKIMMYSLTAFTLSQIARSSNIIIALISVLIVSLNPLIAYLSSEYRFTGLKWLPMISFDFNQFLEHTVIAQGLTLPMAIGVVIITFLLLQWISCRDIVKKDI